MSKFNSPEPGVHGDMLHDATLDPILAAVRHRLDDAVAHPAEAERALLLKAFPEKRRWQVWAIGSVLLATATATILLLQAAPLSPRPLSVTVTNASMGESGYLHHSPDVYGTVEAAFSDGSNFRWRDGARGRIRATTSKGATLAVEEGTLEAKVNPLPGAEWSVEAGPFMVKVTGTMFHVTWSGADETFLLDLHRGRVTITGPLVGSVNLVGGQKISVRLRQGIVSWAEPPATMAPSIPQPTQEPPPVVEAPLAHPAPRKSPPQRSGTSWSALVSRGDFAQVIQNAEAQGIAKSIQTADRAALAALGDAARYARRFDIAEPALKGALQRFPHSIEAEHAAFFLGRIYDDAGRWSDAASWYAGYLSRSPKGSYADEALGRKMIVMSRINTPMATTSSHELAEEYLDRFPLGPYASAARKLLDLR